MFLQTKIFRLIICLTSYEEALVNATAYLAVVK